MTPEQAQRYDRNIRVPLIGVEGQERILRSRVCVIGLGGLGSPAALYLAAAGVGSLVLVDRDRVELSNLQRQILHGTGFLGAPKTDSAAARLSDLSPDTSITTHAVDVTLENVAACLDGCDCVVDATDNFATKYLVNDACVEADVPLATAGILALSGQAMFVVPGRTPCLRCLVPEPPVDVPTTAEQGVLGAVPGVLGSIQALETLRWIAGAWSPPIGGGAVHSVDGESMRITTLRVGRAPECRCATHGGAH